VDLLALANTLLAGLTVLMNEVRQGKSSAPSRERERIRAALIQLERYLNAWAEQAKVTNADARRWAEQPDELAGIVEAALFDSRQAQEMFSASVQSELDSPLIPPRWSLWNSEPKDERALEDVLRVYAPDFHGFLAAFSHRREQLDAMVAELKRRRSEGHEALEEYVAELDDAAVVLENARGQLAAFIATEFPLSGS
jgi:hypothetical protein